MTATTTAPAAIEHPLSPGGLVMIETIETEVRLRAVDGRVARVRLANGALMADFRVEAAPDRLEVRPIRRWPFSLRRVPGPLEVEIPRDARADVETASGSVLALDLTRGAHVRTASGDVELAGIGGEILVNGVSGAIRVRASSSASLELTSVSGRIDAIAASASAIRARSMSGAVRLMAALRGAGPFSLETVSGGITLGTDAPVRLMASTVSGEVRSEVDGAGVARRPGRRTMAVEGPGPEVSARTISGEIRLVAWRDDRGSAPAPGPAEPEGPSAPQDAASTTAASSGAPSDERESGDLEAQRLAVLRALAQGEITVAEAGRRIDALEGPSGG